MELNTEKIYAYAKMVGCLPLLRDFIAKIGFSDVIDKTCPADQQSYLSYGDVTKILVANRLSAPKPLYKIEEWAEKSGVEAVFGIPSSYLNDDRCGRTLEVLGENSFTLKGAISLDIARRFNIGLEHIHWDLTTVHFEGDYENQDSEAIQIVYTKEHTNDHRLKKSIKVGLDVANDGKGPVPIFYEALSGNASGFVETIHNMENLKKHMKLDRIVRINDRGCFSAKILAETKKAEFDLISSVKFTTDIEQISRDAIESATFERMSFMGENQKRKDPYFYEQDGYSAFEIDHAFYYKKEKYPVRLIIVRSDGKVKRDQKNRKKHCETIENELNELTSKLGGSYYTEDRIDKKKTKILSRYPEGKYYDIKIDATKNQLQYKLSKEDIEYDSALDGIILLVTTLARQEYTIDRVFTLFKEQHYIERENHILKGTLRIRPVYLQNQKRIEGLIFVLWLALLCYLLMERIYRLNSSEPKEKKRTARSILECFDMYLYSGIMGYSSLVPNPMDERQIMVYSRLELKIP
jgi:transposase